MLPLTTHDIPLCTVHPQCTAQTLCGVLRDITCQSLYSSFTTLSLSNSIGKINEGHCLRDVGWNKFQISLISLPLHTHTSFHVLSLKTRLTRKSLFLVFFHQWWCDVMWCDVMWCDKLTFETFTNGIFQLLCWVFFLKCLDIFVMAICAYVNCGQLAWLTKSYPQECDQRLEISHSAWF